jgi:hypothetical protein
MNRRRMIGPGDVLPFSVFSLILLAGSTAGRGVDGRLLLMIGAAVTLLALIVDGVAAAHRIQNHGNAVAAAVLDDRLAWQWAAERIAAGLPVPLELPADSPEQG